MSKTVPSQSSVYEKSLSPQQGLTTAKKQPDSTSLIEKEEATTAMPLASKTMAEPENFASFKPQIKSEVVIDVPLKINKLYLGDVTVRLDRAGKIFINAKTLKPLLDKVMRPEAVAKILTETDISHIPISQITSPQAATTVVNKTSLEKASVGQERTVKNHLTVSKENEPKDDTKDIPLTTIKERGLDIHYDTQNSEITVAPNIDQKSVRTLNMGTPQDGSANTSFQTPAFFSGYLNTRAVLTHRTDLNRRVSQTETPSFDFDGAARIGDLVIETEAALTPAHPTNFFLEEKSYDLTRRGTRLIYDLPDHLIRLKAGDLSGSYASFQTAPDFFGISAEKSYAAFQANSGIRPIGQHTFRLERSSSVDILVDGVIVRRLRLEAGDYNIKDLPVNPGATKITLAIEEDAGGSRRTLEFTQFGGADLLAPGINEWYVGGGIRSERTSLDPAKPLFFPQLGYDGPDYYWQTPVVTGFYRIGLTPTTTGSLHGQASSTAAMAGGSLSTQTLYGFLSLDISTSAEFGAYDTLTPWNTKKADRSVGFALRSTYELLNIRDGEGRAHSFRIAGEYQSSRFTSLQNSPAAQDYGVMLTALYARDVSETLMASLSGSVFLSRDAVFAAQRWDVDVTLSKRFSEELSGSFSFGVGEGPSRFDSALCACDNPDGLSGMKAFLRLSYRPDATSGLSSSIDTHNKTSRVTAFQNEGSGVGAWSSLIDAGHDWTNETADLNASLDYTGNRAEVSLSHTTLWDGMSGQRFDPKSKSERTSLRVESGAAFADGAWSIGRPIRNSFAIITTHDSLQNKGLSIGPKDAEIVKKDSLGPALVPDLNAYSRRRVTYEVEDLPEGYDLGTASFDFRGPYKAGYRVEAGSSYTITAIGTLLGRDGKPVPLVEGTARELKEGGRGDVPFFTNREGRIGLLGVAPGRWELRLPTETEDLRYTIQIPDKVTTTYDLGSLKPAL